MQAIDDKILSLVHSMADKAGEIVRPYFRAALAVENKADNSPVTQADREIETALRALIEQAFPDHGIIGEEFGNVREDARYQWVLDPIDGTRAFIAGQTTFATLIALAKDGVPILGVIDQPITGERWLGANNTTTYFRHSREGGNPSILKLDSRLRGNDELRIATTSTDYFRPQEAVAFAALAEKCNAITLGGDAYAYASLASGTLDIVIDASMKPYDYCALAPVITGVGAVITDWAGKPVTIHSNGQVIAAATKELHAQALEILKPAAV